MSIPLKLSAESRAEVMELVVLMSRPIAQVGPEIGVAEETMGNCVRV